MSTGCPKPDCFLKTTLYCECCDGEHKLIVCVTQEEENWRNTILKSQNRKLLHLIAKAAESGKVDSHLTASFIKRWYDVSCLLLDQELIPYHYSTYCSFLLGETLFKKAKAPSFQIVSNCIDSQSQMFDLA